MRSLKKVLLIIPFLCCCTLKLLAQDIPDKIDDIDAPVDTAAFYKKLYEYSKSRKVVYFLYKSVFNPPVRPVKKKSKKPAVKVLAVKKYKGKIIRHILVQSLDPFGTSIHDTSHHPHSVVQKGGNFLHAKTKAWAIRNYLLIRENDKIDPLKLEESERLLRSTGFIREAQLVVQPVAGTKDSFDIVVTTQDYWSLRPSISASTSRVRYRIRENNFGGFGHVFDNRVTDNLKTAGPLILDGSYKVPNLGRTYISPTLFYGTSPENNVQGISVDRPFFSPLTRVASGVEILTKALSDSIQFTEDTTYAYSNRSFVADIWLGYSWRLLKGETEEEQSTRFVTALRYSRLRYLSVKPEVPEIISYFSKSDFYLASISLSSRKYLRERYIFRFGEIEDVPDGHKLTFTTGLENRNDGVRYYFGVYGAAGRFYNSFGYLYSGLGYSTFLKNNVFYKGEVRVDLIYFSPLLKSGKWRARQFVNYNFNYGIDRDESEKIMLNGDIGIPGYKNELPYGTSRMILVSQTIFYSPYDVLGFRFAPILIAGVGMIGGYNQSVFKSKLYQIYGLGLLVKNELLILNSFQIAIAIYPVLPTGGSAIQFNPVKLNESRFTDFDITRPSVSTFN